MHSLYLKETHSAFAVALRQSEIGRARVGEPAGCELDNTGLPGSLKLASTNLSNPAKIVKMFLHHWLWLPD